MKKFTSIIIICLLFSAFSFSEENESSVATESSEIFVNNSVTKEKIAIKLFTSEIAEKWVHGTSSIQNYMIIFQTGKPNEYLAVNDSHGNDFELMGISEIYLTGGIFKDGLMLGMTEVEVQELLGEPTSVRNGRFKYLNYNNISVNFRLGFESNGKLITIRL